jgi:SAM-dependent methyltransferase
MEPAYYDEYYRNEREHWWFRARESILRRQMERMISIGRIPSRPRILNIGAATGRSSQWLGDLGDVVSLEYDGDCCRLTRERTGLEIVEGTILDLPWESDSFDVVCAFDVIEHVEDDAGAVSEMKRVCRKNGILFVTVPASPLLWSEHDEINHHFRRYRIGELKDLFKGCDLLLCSGFNSVLFVPIAAHRVIRRMVDRLVGERSRPLKSDFSRSQFSALSGLLETIFRSESLWLSRGIGLPWGVSAMIIASWAAEDSLAQVSHAASA